MNSPYNLKNIFFLNISVLLWACFFLIVFIGYYQAVLNHFYYFGAGTDAGWFAGMMWQTNFLLPSPSIVDHDESSYYRAHFSPILTLPMLLSYVFSGIGVTKFYAGVIAFFHGIIAFVFSFISETAFSKLVSHRYAVLILSLVSSVAFSFGFLQASHMLLPHFEVLEAAFILSFLYYFLKKSWKCAALSFVLALITREDAGIICSFFLAPYLVWQWIREDQVRPTILFIVLGWVYGIIAIFYIIPHIFNGYGLFYITYIGDVGQQPFAHITQEHLTQRLQFLLFQTTYVWIPLMIISLLSVIFRNPLFLIGVVAILPWLILHVIFCRHFPGGALSYYYAFPVLISVAWSFLIVATDHLNYRTQLSRYSIALLLFCTVLATSANPITDIVSGKLIRDYVFFSFLKTYDLETADNYEVFYQRYNLHKKDLGSIWINFAAGAISPKSFSREMWHFPYGKDKAPEILKQADTLIVFESAGYCKDFSGLDVKTYNAFRVKGTRLLILTKKNNNNLLHFSDLLSDVTGRIEKVCNKSRFADLVR